MKNKSILLLSLLLVGCSTTRYKLAYNAIDSLLEDYSNMALVIEEAYYTDSKDIEIGKHVVLNYSFINMYDQRTNRYYTYKDQTFKEDSKKPSDYYNLAKTSNYYIELNVDKLNNYIDKKD